MSISTFTVLGTISVAAGAKVNVAAHFAAKIGGHSPAINTIYFEANEGNSARILTGDADSDPASQDTWGASLAAGSGRSYSSGTASGQSIDSFWVSATSGTQKVRISVLK